MDDRIIALELTSSQLSIVRDLVDDSIYEVEHYGRLLNGADVRPSEQKGLLSNLQDMYDSISQALGVDSEGSRERKNKGHHPPYR